MALSHSNTCSKWSLLKAHNCKIIPSREGCGMTFNRQKPISMGSHEKIFHVEERWTKLRNAILQFTDLAILWKCQNANQVSMDYKKGVAWNLQGQLSSSLSSILFIFVSLICGNGLQTFKPVEQWNILKHDSSSILRPDNGIECPVLRCPCMQMKPVTILLEDA